MTKDLKLEEKEHNDAAAIPAEHLAMPQNRTPAPIVCDVLNSIATLDISNCNSNFQLLVVDYILQSGKHIDDLTIKELRKIIENVAHEFRAE